MTREEATAYWKQRSKHIHNWLEENEDVDFIGEYVEAIDMAIESLQAEMIPKHDVEIIIDEITKRTSPTDGDLISRADAIDAIIAEGRTVDSRYLESERIVHECDAVEALAMLPSARPTGEWTKDGQFWKCSNCGARIFSETEIDRKYHHAFCGVCGADMRGGDSE